MSMTDVLSWAGGLACLPPLTSMEHVKALAWKGIFLSDIMQLLLGPHQFPTQGLSAERRGGREPQLSPASGTVGQEGVSAKPPPEGLGSQSPSLHPSLTLQTRETLVWPCTDWLSSHLWRKYTLSCPWALQLLLLKNVAL